MLDIKVIETVAALAAKIQSISKDVLAKHIQRDEIVKATFLALVSGRPGFFLGLPGIDKTGTIQDLARRIQGAIFYDALMPTIISVEQLLVESTSIEEKPTENGGKSISTRDTLGRAAKAHLLFADEIWKAEPRVLQTLIDLAKGDGVRHEGQMVKTPLLAFLSASNELPDIEGNLGAIWSRMTIRVAMNPLDRAGKAALVKARLVRDRNLSATQSIQLTLADIELLRKVRPQVEVPDNIMEIVLDILERLRDEKAQDFAWAWADDRRFGRIFDVMQANALLEGRTQVGKQDLAVLEWLLWDTPEQIPVVKANIAPYCRTPLMDAQELVNALLSPTGAVEEVRKGSRAKGVQAITQCEEAEKELSRLKRESNETAMTAEIDKLINQVNSAKADVVAVFMGTKKIV
ncbi:AAA family ATPase [Patescibacteria group bacterium]|nr:AAA family ATPase [Patescibacteria group bacterium]